MLQPPSGNLMQEAFVCQDVTQWTWNLWNACYVPEPWRFWTLWKEVIVQHTWPIQLIFSSFILLTNPLFLGHPVHSWRWLKNQSVWKLIKDESHRVFWCALHLISKHRSMHHAFLFSFSMHHEMFSQGWIYSLRLLWANSSIHLLSQVQLWYKDRNTTIPPGKVTVFIVPCTQRASTWALLASRLLQWPSSWDPGSMAFFSPPPTQEVDEEPDVLQQDDPPLNRYL